MTSYTLSAVLFIATLSIIGCSQSDNRAKVENAANSQIRIAAQSPIRADTFSSTHKLVYVPTYSHIYIQDGQRDFDLAATLSIRNTDPEAPLTVLDVTYFDSNGRQVRKYVESPFKLAPLASRPYVIEESDRTGGVGANFVVEWRSEQPISEPVIEAVMISTASNQGISFVSRGVVVRPIRPDEGKQVE